MPINEGVKGPPFRRRRHVARRARIIVGATSVGAYAVLAVNIGWSQRQVEIAKAEEATNPPRAEQPAPAPSLARIDLGKPAILATPKATTAPTTTSTVAEIPSEPAYLAPEGALTDVAPTTTVAPVTTTPTATAPPTTTSPPTTTVATTTTTTTVAPSTSTTTIVATTTTIFSGGS